ncbi:hypothetical protein QUV83_14265 [Cellulomonas cellasea]|uniref:hypothetical protein n=1 Tax=Cellulomonas cellasea TaxID=43670 RepID=UPI0025A33542|nr:hypothetical protein [Cellulomonas cellasea]MDM8085937.1 hypothetical protein [Cellulomonas cellasea]
MTLPAKKRAPEARPRTGFVLYVGLRDEDDATTDAHPSSVDGTAAFGAAELTEIAETLRDLARDLLPTAETFTALSLVPGGSGPDDVQSLRHRLSHLRLLEAPPTVLGGSGDAR